MTYWADIYGRDASGVEIMRNWHIEQPAMTLAEFCAHVNRAIWGDDANEGEDWRDIARQVERDALHSPEWSTDDVAAGLAQVVRCPDCGQMEIWSNAEVDDHGLCRTEGGPCQVC